MIESLVEFESVKNFKKLPKTKYAAFKDSSFVCKPLYTQYLHIEDANMTFVEMSKMFGGLKYKRMNYKL